jgi:hypothetical protein
MELPFATYSRLYCFCRQNGIDTVYSWSRKEYSLYYRHKKLATLTETEVLSEFGEQHERDLLSAMSLLDMFV